jgi:HEPN domain-containing protein
MKRLTREWLSKAESDLLLAGDLGSRSRRSHDHICFHCPQAAEKFLKAVLQERGTPFGRTHSLENLFGNLGQTSSAFRELRRGLRFLAQFAVDVRYPGFRASRRQAEAALRWAERVRACWNPDFEPADIEGLDNSRGKSARERRKGDAMELPRSFDDQIAQGLVERLLRQLGKVDVSRSRSGRYGAGFLRLGSVAMGDRRTSDSRASGGGTKGGEATSTEWGRSSGSGGGRMGAPVGWGEEPGLWDKDPRDDGHLADNTYFTSNT